MTTPHLPEVLRNVPAALLLVALLVAGAGGALALLGASTQASGRPAVTMLASTAPDAPLVSAQAGPIADLLPDYGPGGDADRSFRFHVRILANDLLVFSTWSGERGALQGSAADGEPANTSPENFPPVLAPLREIIHDAPRASSIEIKALQLPMVAYRDVELAMTQEFEREGVLPPSLAEYVASANASAFHIGGLPVGILATEGGYRYDLDLAEPLLLPVPRTDGLFFLAEPVSEGIVRITLEAPSGEFTSEGCQPVPGTRIPPGHYVRASAQGATHTYRVYESFPEYALQGQRVDVEITILEHEQVGTEP